MASQCFSLVRGRVMRATRLDACGRRANAACSSITTKGFISVGFTANTDAGTAISVTNANGDICVSDTPRPVFTGYTVQIAFCEVNPDLYAMLTGQDTVFDAAGNAVGFRVSSDPADSGVALELWSTVPSVACDPLNPNAVGSYGYVLVPFLQGGQLGDFTLENGAVTFTISGATTKGGSGWGIGPYNVTLDNDGAPTGLLQPIGATDHLHVQYTTVAPPAPGCACTTFGTAAATVTAGAPGAYPLNAYPPANLVAARTGPFVASPATAWTVGQYIVLGDGTEAYWDGTSWEPGRAPTTAPTAFTAGTPGAITPVGATPPQSIFALDTATPAITATPATAWTAGQYIVLGNAGFAYWDGIDWKSGKAP